MASSEDLAKAHKAFFDEGIKIRTEVTGAAHVKRSLENVSEFGRPIQELATEVGWGNVWARPGLDRRTRSLLNISMLCALNRAHELGVHVRGAVNNGCTEDEIKETILQVALYCGFPAGLEGTRIAEAMLKNIKAEKEAGQK